MSTSLSEAPPRGAVYVARAFPPLPSIAPVCPARERQVPAAHPGPTLEIVYDPPPPGAQEPATKGGPDCEFVADPDGSDDDLAFGPGRA